MEELYEELKNKTLKKKGKVVDKRTIKSITPREMEVYDLVVRKGMPRKQVAFQLGIGVSYISMVLKNLKEKMNLEFKNGKRITKTDEIDTKENDIPLKMLPVPQM